MSLEEVFRLAPIMEDQTEDVALQAPIAVKGQPNKGAPQTKAHVIKVAQPKVVVLSEDDQHDILWPRNCTACIVTHTLGLRHLLFKMTLTIAAMTSDWLKQQQ